LPVLYGCETWLSHIELEHRLRVFENRVLRELLGFMRDVVAGECWKNYTMNFFICTTYPILFGWPNQEIEVAG